MLAAKLDRITIFSIRESAVPSEEYRINNCHILIKFLSPKFLEIGDSKKQRYYVKQKGAFPVIPGIIEKLLNGKEIYNELKKLYREVPYDYVHLLDNFGFGNRLIVKVPSPVSVSAMSYQGKGIIYNNYLRLSYKVPNLKIIPYSYTYAKKMEQLGIHKDSLRCIKWGVNLHNQKQQLENRKKIAVSLSLPSEKPLFVWAGYIQQIQKKDFLYAIKVAKKALSNGINCAFFFAFKHEDKKCFSLNDPEKGIFIKKTSVDEFDLLKQIADVFYSPIVNRKCIVAPPLTWIEFLSLGVPILSTNAGGVDEIVIDGKTGYIATSDDELLEKMFTITEKYSVMSSYCYDKVFTSYNIATAAKEYLDLWYSGEH